jgi:hypothetical protein
VCDDFNCFIVLELSAQEALDGKTFIRLKICGLVCVVHRASLFDGIKLLAARRGPVRVVAGWLIIANEKDCRPASTVRLVTWRLMSRVTLSIPDELLLALQATPDEFASRLRFAASVKLYEMGNCHPARQHS